MSHRGGCYVIDAEIESLMETDPIAAHTKIMEMTRSQPVIVHKEYTGRQPFDDNENGDPLPMSSDEQIDVLAAVIVEMKNDLRAEFQNIVENAVGSLADQVAMMQAQVNVLQGQVSTLLSVIGNNTNSGTRSIVRSIEATETVRKRRVRVRSDDK
jgi:hypothetical protein